jgi:type VI secretion system protein ImpK
MPTSTLPLEAERALRRFRQFYDELFTIKRLLREGDWATLIGRRAAVGTTEEQVLLAVRLRLRSAIAAHGFGGAASARTPGGIDPGYVWAAVADASLLHDVSWPGRDGWAETPLEVVLYRSRVAGDRIFEVIEELARCHTPDPDGIAMTILLALELGFRGRYHGNDDHGEIERLKTRLHDLIFQGSTAFGEFDGLTVGAAEALSARFSTNLPSVRPWRLAIFGVVVGYLLLSWLIWWRQVGDIVLNARDAAKSLSLLG